MKKLLISILIILCTVLIGYGVVKGLKTSVMEVKSIDEIDLKKEEYQEQLGVVEDLISETYAQQIQLLESRYTSLIATQKQYQEKLEVSTSSYKIEKLFVKLGNHATSEGIDLKIDVTDSYVGMNMYNLTFQAYGSYIGITDFISAIENDSELGFKIEEFSINSYESLASTNKLFGRFVCKDIMIEDVNSTDEVIQETIESIE